MFEREQNLKPCPFCGVIPRTFTAKNGSVRVECCWNHCEVNPKTRLYVTASDAIEAWNRRSGGDSSD